MRRLFAVVLSALLVFAFAPVAKADVAGLTPAQKVPVSSNEPLQPPQIRPKLASRCTAKHLVVTMDFPSDR